MIALLLIFSLSQISWDFKKTENSSGSWFCSDLLFSWLVWVWFLPVWIYRHGENWSVKIKLKVAGILILANNSLVPLIQSMGHPNDFCWLLFILTILFFTLKLLVSTWNLSMHFCTSNVLYSAWFDFGKVCILPTMFLHRYAFGFSTFVNFSAAEVLIRLRELKVWIFWFRFSCSNRIFSYHLSSKSHYSF